MFIVCRDTITDNISVENDHCGLNKREAIQMPIVSEKYYILIHLYTSKNKDIKEHQPPGQACQFSTIY